MADTQERRERAAYHEAGHALAAVLTGVECDGVTLRRGVERRRCAAYLWCVGGATGIAGECVRLKARVDAL